MQLKPLHLIPLGFSLASFVLVMLVFFAGRQGGFLEEYDLIRVSPLVDTFSSAPVHPVFGGKGE